MVDMTEQSYRPSSRPLVNLAIVGAGASGLACALRTAQVLNQKGLRHVVRIEVYESSKKIGHSILASGNGRCNYSNTKIYCDGMPTQAGSEYYTNANFVEQVRTVCCETVVPAPEWLSALGLLGREGKAYDGMLFPVSNQAKTVLDTLLYWCDVYGIVFVPQARVNALSCVQDMHDTQNVSDLLDMQSAHVMQNTQTARFSLSGIRQVAQEGNVGARSKSKKKTSKVKDIEVPFTRTADMVVLAVGHALSQNSHLALMQPCTAMRPVLGPLVAEPLGGWHLKDLDGVRQRVMLRVVPKNSDQPIFIESGEVLFRPYGISGIVVFNASRYAQPGDVIELDLLPDFTHEDLVRHFFQTYQTWQDAELSLSSCSVHTVEDVVKMVVTGVLAQPLCEAFVSLVCEAIQRESHTSWSSLASTQDAYVLCQHIATNCKALTLTVKDIASDQTCQVMRGGCDVAAINPATCESRRIKQFYVIGEALDVDGPCGGFNLDWAWTSGIVAGEAIAQAALTMYRREANERGGM